MQELYVLLMPVTELVRMESMQHTARGIPDEAAAIHNADRKITEDTDLNDLPVHFQPMKDGGRGRAATGVLPSPHTPLGQQVRSSFLMLFSVCENLKIP